MAGGYWCEHGGRIALCELIDSHAEALEADLLRHYGVDIYAYHRGEISSRRLINLIRRLPPDSELGREMHGEAAEWSRTDHLLAILADRIADLHWAFVCANSENPPGRPEPLPRPGVAPTEVTGATRSEMTDFFFS